MIDPWNIFLQDLTYSGPLTFHYKGDTGKISRLMSLTDKDTIKDILPILRQKFDVPDTMKTTVRQTINGGNIFLLPNNMCIVSTEIGTHSMNKI